MRIALFPLLLLALAPLAQAQTTAPNRSPTDCVIYNNPADDPDNNPAASPRIAIGILANAATGGTAVGTLASVENQYGTAYGYQARAAGRHATAVGHLATAEGCGSSAVGTGARAQGRYAQAFGHYAGATGDGAVANGPGAQATGLGTMAQGSGARATGNGALAVGMNSQATAPNSVALGAGSIANQANTVSVGRVGAERRITNVANAINPTDAVNLRQVEAMLDDRWGDVNNRFGDINRRIDGLGAMSAALTMGAQAAVNTNKRNSLSAGAGFYNGQSAFAVSYTHRRTGKRFDSAFSAGIAFTSGDSMGGVGYSIGW